VELLLQFFASSQDVLPAAILQTVVEKTQVNLPLTRQNCHELSF
jgi:hypothetical protein